MKWPFVRRSKYLYLNQNYLEARSMFESYAQMNRDNLIEINRLNKELASELNNHRETKEALKIVKEDLRQHQMALSAADLRADKAKSEISKIRGYLRKIAKDL